ncbi:conjugative transfer ATPase [Alicycliphilus denitrificans]|uniref:conjugative transfer ATPase n=1 Tax=Alicycliphilus denitrificans TaxID=179636 RepID=UPI00384FB7EF
MTAGDRTRMALRPPSFTDLLPYVAYSEDDQLFVMRDGETMGAMFELSPVATEAQPEAYLMERCRKVQQALQALPEAETHHWIVQFFVNDDRNIDPLNQLLIDYVLSQHKDNPQRGQEVLQSEYTQSVLSQFTDHLAQVSRPQGLFTDTIVTGQVWRGQQRRVRCCIFRRFSNLAEDTTTPAKQILAVGNTVMATFTEAGIQARRCTGRDFYEWLLPFFNRKVPWASTPGELLKTAPYPGPQPASMFDWDLAESLTLSQPRAVQADGHFEFDGVPVKALTLQNLRAEPGVGHFSAEIKNGNECFARFDRMPPGSMLSITVVITPQHLVERRIETIRDKSRAQTAHARETFNECERVLQHMISNNDRLLPMMMTLYLTGKDKADLADAVTQANALLGPTGLRFVDPKQDLVPLDSFLRALPFNFDTEFDKRYLVRSRLTFASHIAALLPVYGRSRGSAHPGMWFWNRGGEPLWMDPLNRSDRKKNAHMLTFGPTGAGKSATLVYQCMLTMAVHRPRLIIVDAGNSFGLMVADMQAKGLTTRQLVIDNNCDISLPPFVHAYKLLQDSDVMVSFHAAEEQSRASNLAADEDALPKAVEKVMDQIDSKLQERQEIAESSQANEPDQDDADEANEPRDFLGEMLISAIMMITGGEAAEVEKLGRSDRYLITRAIIKAAVKCQALGHDHPLVQDVALELIEMVKDKSLSEARRYRAEDMGQSMMSFTQGLRGRLFNRYGTDWPDVDVTVVEMGVLVKDGYGDALALAYTSLVDFAQSRAELNQYSGRHNVFLTDEGHLITTNELLGPKVAKGTKMWRKLSLWFWMATQNLKDFPGSMSRVLSMCEFWMLLTMDKSETEEVTRFRSLTPEQRAMMESATKEPRKYTEGVLINATGQWLFRNVPPALSLALAQTEGDEKARRRRLMDAHGCSELEAAYLVAQQIADARG